MGDAMGKPYDRTSQDDILLIHNRAQSRQHRDKERTFLAFSLFRSWGQGPCGTIYSWGLDTPGSLPSFLISLRS